MQRRYTGNVTCH